MCSVSNELFKCSQILATEESCLISFSYPLYSRPGRVKSFQLQTWNYVAFCTPTVYGNIQGPIAITVIELIKGGLYCLLLMQFSLLYMS